MTPSQLVRVIFPNEAYGTRRETAKERVSKALKRLQQKKEADRKPMGRFMEFAWFLKGTPQPNTITYHHDFSCAELYIALEPYLDDCDDNWQCEKQNKTKGKQFRYDRRAVMFGETIYFEVETGSQENLGRKTAKKIEDKLHGYIEHYQETREDFCVVFTVQDYIRNKLRETVTPAKIVGKKIDEILAESRLPDRYLIAYHSELISDPMTARLVGRKAMYTLGSLV